MLLGKKAKPASPEEMALVHHALESPIRRNMIILMNQGLLRVPEIAQPPGRRCSSTTCTVWSWPG